MHEELYSLVNSRGSRVQSRESRLKGRDSKMLNKIGKKYQIHVLKDWRHHRTVWNFSDFRNSGRVNHLRRTSGLRRINRLRSCYRRTALMHALSQLNRLKTYLFKQKIDIVENRYRFSLFLSFAPC